MVLSDLFPTLLDMSFTASLVILAVCVLRLLLKRAPKLFSYGLWLVVLFRLLCPVSFETAVSILPDRIPVTAAQVETTLSAPTAPAEEALPRRTAPFKSETDTLATPPHPISPAAAAETVWLCGVGGMLLYGFASLLRLRRRLVGTVRLRDNVYLADHIPTAFVLGVFRPRIYLPSSLSVEEQRYILLHEQAHIRRGDHLVLLAGFFALSLHWFNPLVWLAFHLAVNDMELSCDERVLKRMDQRLRPEYSASLLNLAAGRHIFPVHPLAFGEGNVKERIKNVMNYKTPTLAGLTIGLAICVAATVCLASNPVSGPPNDAETALSATPAAPADNTLNAAVSNAILTYNQERYLAGECAGEGHSIMDYDHKDHILTVYVLTTYGEYQFIDDILIESSGCGILPAVITFQINQDGSYTTLNYQEPEDGGMYLDSIKELFPQRLQARCLNAGEDSALVSDLRSQQDQYAAAYLASIGREAEIGDYADLDQPLLTDLGVSVEVSNHLIESKALSNYPLGVGKQEWVEDGVRYVYQTSYDAKEQIISYVKISYETGKIVEQYCFDATDGTLLQNLSHPRQAEKS